MNQVFQRELRRFCFIIFVPLIAFIVPAADSLAQVNIKFMSVGSLRSWFASTGCEIEEGRVLTQQDGLEWPSYYRYQDTEAAKGMWIGATNFTDPTNFTFPYAVVHVGPRVAGTGEVFPILMEMVSKFEPPKIYVDGALTSSGRPVINDRVDPTLPCDRIIINEVNTLLGITMTRKIMGFSQEFHDNYFIYEYVFKNTGNVNADPTIELPSQTLTGVYFYFQYRYAVCAEARYVIGNSAGWGINTMNDSRGDSLTPATTFFPGNRDNDIRAQYAWHGWHPGKITSYDNIGASVWNPPQSTFEPFSDRTDTSGRLTAPQFVGNATLFASRSATDQTDDIGQPSTTSYESSDDPVLNFNNRFPGNSAEYDAMRRRHLSPRHADKVGQPPSDPSQGLSTASSTGGQSSAKGYGPYTLAPGDSIRIVMVEAVAGLSREKAISVGERFKNGNKFTPPLPGGITAAQKNDSVYTGRDSLFQTFRRAIANYAAGFNIPQPPYPPKQVDVTSSGDKISLTWDLYGDGPTVTGFRVYRSTGKSDGMYTRIHQGDLPASARSFDDTTTIRGGDNYYYVVAVGDPADNTGGGLTPPGVALTSNRSYSQSYEAAQLRRPAGTVMSAIRIVPNPYIISSNINTQQIVTSQGVVSLRIPGAPDRLAFYNIPGYCTIRIYTELGELVYTIEHKDGSGDAYWQSITSSNQVVVSGVYIAVIQDTKTGEMVRKKFVIIR